MSHLLENKNKQTDKLQLGGELSMQEWRLEFDPQNSYKKPGVKVHVCNPALGKLRKVESQGFLAI